MNWKMEDDKWKIFNNLRTEPGTTSINFNGDGYADGNLMVGNMEIKGKTTLYGSLQLKTMVVTTNILLDFTHSIIFQCFSFIYSQI